MITPFELALDLTIATITDRHALLRRAEFIAHLAGLLTILAALIEGSFTRLAHLAEVTLEDTITTIRPRLTVDEHALGRAHHALGRRVRAPLWRLLAFVTLLTVIDDHVAAKIGSHIARVGAHVFGIGQRTHVRHGEILSHIGLLARTRAIGPIGATELRARCSIRAGADQQIAVRALGLSLLLAGASADQQHRGQ